MDRIVITRAGRAIIALHESRVEHGAVIHRVATPDRDLEVEAASRESAEEGLLEAMKIRDAVLFD